MFQDANLFACCIWEGFLVCPLQAKGGHNHTVPHTGQAICREQNCNITSSVRACWGENEKNAKLRKLLRLTENSKRLNLKEGQNSKETKKVRLIFNLRGSETNQHLETMLVILLIGTVQKCGISKQWIILFRGELKLCFHNSNFIV